MSSLLQTPLIAGLLVLFAKVTVLLALAAAAQWLLGRRASAATRHGLWALMVVTLLLLLPLSLAGPEWPVAVTVADAPAPVAAAPDSQVQLNTAPPSLDAPSVSRMAAGDREVRPATPARVSWPAMAFFAYAAGVMVLLARLVASQIFARRIVSTGEEIRDSEWKSLLDSCARALGVSTPVRLLRAPAQVMPMVIGLRKPAVLVSDDAETWSEDRRRAVMLHELAHVRRRDSLTQTLASLATALYWPHPGVWWAARRLQVEREFACDDCVLGAGASADSYASDLLEIAYSLGGRRPPALAVTMARRGQLEGRLLAVLDAARNRATSGVGKPRRCRRRGACRPRARGSHRDHHASGVAAGRGRRLHAADADRAVTRRAHGASRPQEPPRHSLRVWPRPSTRGPTWSSKPFLRAARGRCSHRRRRARCTSRCASCIPRTGTPCRWPSSRA